MSRCKSCGAAIVWARTIGGKRMPVDAEPSAGGSVVLHGDGTCTVVPLSGKPDGVSLHKSHFATCPNAEEHRKPRSQLGLFDE